MDRQKTCEEVVALFIRLVNKYRSLEKIPVDYGTNQVLYHSERHMIDQIGGHPRLNMTEFARIMGVTKGAVSQVVKKLEAKGAVRRCKSTENDKEVFIELTDSGRAIYAKHQKVNAESIGPLYEELKKYSDDKVYFLVEMFKWFDSFLDSARAQMLKHSTDAH
jgi:DNA-binding MarR family transcriptional regulator